jgi:hypothetical protein
MALPTLQQQAYLEALGFAQANWGSDGPDYGSVTYADPVEAKVDYEAQHLFDVGKVDTFRLRAYYPPTRVLKDLTAYVQDITWTEAEGQSGVMGSVDFVDLTPQGALLDWQDKTDVRSLIACPGLILIYETALRGQPLQERQRWISWSPTVGGPGMDTIQFYDALVYLANAQGSFGYTEDDAHKGGWTASEITADICRRYSIPTTSIVAATHRIPYFLFTGSIYDAIATAYAFERHYTGNYFYITVDQGKLVVRRSQSILHDINAAFLLDPTDNLRTPSTFTRSLDQYAGGIIPTGTDEAGDPDYIVAGNVDPNAAMPESGTGDTGAQGIIGASGDLGKSTASSKNLQCKGSDLTKTQINNVNIILGVGTSKNAPRSALIASMYAGMGETSLGEDASTYTPNGAATASSPKGFYGVLQGSVSAWPDPHDTAGMAQAFFTGDGPQGQTDFKSAIQLATTTTNSAEIAVKTEQPSVWPDDAYAKEWSGGSVQGIAEAVAIVNAYQGTSPSTNSGEGSAAAAKAAGITLSQAAGASQAGAALTEQQLNGQLASGVLFGTMIFNAKVPSIRDPNYSKKAAQLLSNALARASKELDCLADGNTLIRQGARVHVLGYPLDLFVSSATHTVSRTDYTMQLAIAWREFEVSDMEDYHAVQEAGSQYAYEESQATAPTKKSSASDSTGSDKKAAAAISSLKTPPGGYTPTTFAKALLSALGAPATSANVASLTAWEAREGGNFNNTAKYNPINTERVEPGSTDYKPGGAVQAYTSWSQGLQATVATLQQSQYVAIVTALKAGHGLKGNTPGMAQALLTWSDQGYSSI